MDLRQAAANLADIQPIEIVRQTFVRAFDTDVRTRLGREFFFDCTYSYQRGYRYNFPGEHPVLYLAADHLAASVEIGPTTWEEVIAPLVFGARSPYLYVTVEVSARVLDLTDRGVRRALDVTLDELMIPSDQWQEEADRGRKAVTHEIGALVLADDRFDGFLYPSWPSREFLKLDKTNLALFMDLAHSAMARPKHRRVRLAVVDHREILKKLGLKL